MNEDLKCCFTGHRPEKLPFTPSPYSYSYLQFRKALEHAIQDAINSGYRYFITGMARGVDLWSAQIVLRFKKSYPDLILEAAIPFEGQEKLWNEEDRRLYNDVRSSCDKVTVLLPHHTKSAMYNRNRYMIDNSSFLIAAYNGEPGGTAYTVEYAKEKGLRIVNIFDEEYYGYSIL